MAQNNYNNNSNRNNNNNNITNNNKRNNIFNKNASQRMVKIYSEDLYKNLKLLNHLFFSNL